MKVCLGCEVAKPLEAFHKCKTVRDGRKSRCAECCRAESREWRSKNPDKQKAAVDSWRARNAERYAELKRESDRKYRVDNLEKIRAQREARRDELSAMLTEWKRNNREKVRDYERRRRAAIRGSRIEEVDLELAWLESSGVCGICATGMDRSIPWPHPEFPSLDHIIPLARGGGHIQENVRYVHLRCNIRKNDRLDAELTSTAILP